MSDNLPVTLRSATELLTLLKARELSATELLEAHLDRIARLNPH